MEYVSGLSWEIGFLEGDRAGEGKDQNRSGLVMG